MESSHTTLVWLDRQAVRRGLALAATLLAVALCIELGLVIKANRVEASRRDAVVVAERVAEGLTTFRADHRDDATASIRSDLTGALARQVASERTLLKSLLKDSAAMSRGSADVVGIESSSSNRSHVLVALTARVKNKDAPRGEIRRYRMRLTLSSIDGTWRASRMEMVP